jgi:hypothetical protein
MRVRRSGNCRQNPLRFLGLPLPNEDGRLLIEIRRRNGTLRVRLEAECVFITLYTFGS